MTQQEYNQWWADHYLQQEQEELLWFDFVLELKRQRLYEMIKEGWI